MEYLKDCLYQDIEHSKKKLHPHIIEFIKLILDNSNHNKQHYTKSLLKTKLKKLIEEFLPPNECDNINFDSYLEHF